MGRPRFGTARPLEDDRPFALVVAGDAGDTTRVVRRDVGASLAGEPEGLGLGQIEEPEIDRALAVAEDEVGLARAVGTSEGIWIATASENSEAAAPARRSRRTGPLRPAAPRAAPARRRATSASPKARAADPVRPRAPTRPPPREARAATARSARSSRRCGRASARAGRSTRRRRWPARSRTVAGGAKARPAP